MSKEELLTEAIKLKPEDRFALIEGILGECQESLNRKVAKYAKGSAQG